jgi:hypothetical protein
MPILITDKMYRMLVDVLCETLETVHHDTALPFDRDKYEHKLGLVTLALVKECERQYPKAASVNVTYLRLAKYITWDDMPIPFTVVEEPTPAPSARQPENGGA